MGSSWRWTTAVAAVSLALLTVFLLISPRPPVRQETRAAPPSLETAMVSLHAAVANAPLELSRTLPTWMSPTASLLDPPGFTSMPVQRN
jgi:hypothetical protein